MYLNWLEHFGISFMKIKNRRGPKIDPCGTPHWITLVFESTLFIDTYCSLFVRYERNQSKAIPLTPEVFNFDSRISWLTQSNVFRKSRNKENTILPVCKLIYKLISLYKLIYTRLQYYHCKKCKMAWVVDFLARNPYCCFAGSSYFPNNHTAVYMLLFQIPC